ncbi:MAG TPA: amino acid adenylation domain-containing protein [Sorangium sp.]|nr:amino acid adenylation domain-containing protein [Sorangium sp.]
MLITVLRQRAAAQADRCAFVFLDYEHSPAGSCSSTTMTYGELDVQARALAAELQRRYTPGDRALLLLRSERSFIASFFGCLYAGLVAVPLPPLRSGASQLWLRAIAEQSRASVVLVDGPWQEDVISHATSPAAQALDWLRMDEIDPALAGAWRDPDVHEDALAFLQYTSGSTGAPKGVMVSHRNLMVTSADLNCGWEHDDDSVMVTWLPMFHDMGLIYGVLQPVFRGFVCHVMTPRAFLHEPLRWLEAMSALGGTHTAAPNFAYDLCVRRYRRAAPRRLDLSRWEVAVNGGEPVDAATLSRFVETFGPSGFGPRVFAPGYGLAEGTLKVAASARDQGPMFVAVDKAALERGAVVFDKQSPSCRTLVGNGKSHAGATILIVDPETQHRCPAGRVGEIWVSGPMVAGGYWERPDVTEQTFHARLSGDDASGPYLRTGDLGFLHEGALFVTGRLKDLLIIRGSNHYPQDIERTVQTCHPAFRPGRGCAVSIQVEGSDGEERLAVAQELDEDEIGRLDLAELAATVRRAVAAEHGVHVSQVVFLHPGALVKTSSGKLRRRACRDDLLAGRLREVWRSAVEDDDEATVEERARQLIEGALLGASRVGEGSLYELGLDSLRAAELVAQIARELHVEVPLQRILSATTLGELASAISGLVTLEPPQVDHAPALLPAPQDRHHPFPLSDLQQAYWVGRSGAFEFGNVRAHAYLEIETACDDVDRLNAALRRLVARHDLLRAVILPNGQQQIREPERVDTVPEVAVSSGDPAQLAMIRREMSDELALSDDHPPIEMRLSRSALHGSRLHLRVDLTVADFRSLLILLRELRALYDDPDAALPALELTYRDYLLATHAIAGSAAHQRAQQYWWSRLDALPPAPELPLARNPGSIARPRFTRRTQAVESGVWSCLKARAARAGLTPSALCLAVFVEMVRTWSARGDFTITVTTLSRQPLHPQVDDLVGDFASTVLLAVDAEPGADLLARALRLQRRLWEDLEHRAISGVQVLRERARRRGAGRSSAMPVVFTSTLGVDSQGASLESFGRLVHSANPTPHVYLSSHVLESGGALVVHIDTVDELFPAGFPEEFLAAFGALLELLAGSDAAWHAQQRRWTPPAQLAQRAAINATERPLSGDRLHTRFVANARLHPNRTALLAPDRTLSYGELAQRAGALALHLRDLGAAPNTLIAVILDKGWEQTVAVLAISMSGAAYLPIEAGLPAARRRLLLDEGGVKIVVTQQALVAKLDLPEGSRLVCVDEVPHALEIPRIEDTQTPDDLAYVIYTSGSTGRPKGVMIDHKGAVNTILDINDRFAVGPDDRVLAISALGFDLSVYDIFGTLAAGATLVTLDADSAMEPARWASAVVKHRVTIWNSVPALMQLLVERAEGSSAGGVSALRLVMLSGDLIPVGLPDRIRAAFGGAQVVSLGGATEASIWSVVYPIGIVDTAWRTIPYGKPLSNQGCHVLDERLEPCPVWVPGRLYISGTGVALGYRDQPSETDARFTLDPLTGRRIYLTGDLARYLPDGNLEFLGREDFQVKINGFRIELAEIEAVLARSPAVLQAVAVVDTAPGGERRIVAYAVPSNGESLATHDVLAHARALLPSYMVPSRLIPMKSLPLSANGKVDRAALPPPSLSVSTPPSRRKTTAMEQRIAAVIASVLGVGAVDHQQNLFELGATSLHMLRIQTRLANELGVDLKVVDLFTHPSAVSLATHLVRAPAERDPAVRELAEAQKAFFRRPRRRAEDLS